MNRFENELKNGNFTVTECIDCKQIVWPTSDFCNICHNHTHWRNANDTGKIIEFSKKNDEYFSEYAFPNRLKTISGFSGSAGFAIILKDINYLFVDGRYVTQAKIESGKNF